MNKSEIIAHISTRYNIDKQILTNIIPEIFKFINSKIVAGESVNIKNFGTFYLIERSEQIKYHPIKKSRIKVPAKKLIKFRPSRNGFIVE